jgi:hypothetical protein
LVFLAYRFIDINGSVEREMLYNEYEKIVYSGIEAYAHSRGDGKSDDPDRSWAVLFERKFIVENGLLYVSKIPYLEDGEFIARVLCLAKICTFSSSLFYIRTTRPGSATNSNLFIQERTIDGFIRAAISLKNFSNRGSLNIQQKFFLNQPIVKFCFLSVQASIMRRRFSTYRKVYKTLRQNSLSKLSLDTCFGVYKKFGRVYNISINLFALWWVVNAIMISIRVRIKNYV